jgi:hypothetical protein
MKTNTAIARPEAGSVALPAELVEARTRLRAGGARQAHR